MAEPLHAHARGWAGSLLDGDEDVDANAAGWAAPLTADDGAVHAKGWATSLISSDDDDGPAQQPILPAPTQARPIVLGDIKNAISALTDKSLKSTVKSIMDDITKILREPSDHSIVQSVQLFDGLCEKLATIQSKTDTLADFLNDPPLHTFATEQLRSTDEKQGLHLESHSTEENRLGCTRQMISRKRRLGASALVALQRSMADVLVELMCDKVELAGGQCLTMFEKHRGDETPFARCSATDTIGDNEDATPTNEITDNPADAIACQQKKSLEDIDTTSKPVLIASTASANLKVYQVDLEISCLYLLKDRELLISFKLLTPLTRLDRCTGRSYKWLHEKQSNVLNSRKRFVRNQRIHTSDGDGAQDLAERALAHDWAKSDVLYPVPCFRSQCTVHRVYHCMTKGMKVFSSFVTGQIKLALSLRGPGNFKAFKEIFWEYLLGHHEFHEQGTHLGPGVSADDHRGRIWGIFSRNLKGFGVGTV